MNIPPALLQPSLWWYFRKNKIKIKLVKYNIIIKFDQKSTWKVINYFCQKGKMMVGGIFFEEIKKFMRLVCFQEVGWKLTSSELEFSKQWIFSWKKSTTVDIFSTNFLFLCKTFLITFVKCWHIFWRAAISQKSCPTFSYLFCPLFPFLQAIPFSLLTFSSRSCNLAVISISVLQDKTRKKLTRKFQLSRKKKQKNFFSFLAC